MTPKFGRWIVVAVVALVLLNFIFGRTGVITLVRLRQETASLREQIVEKEYVRDSLLIVEERLKSDPDYIERVVREELGYCLPGETVLKIVSEE